MMKPEQNQQHEFTHSKLLGHKSQMAVKSFMSAADECVPELQYLY